MGAGLVPRGLAVPDRAPPRASDAAAQAPALPRGGGEAVPEGTRLKARPAIVLGSQQGGVAHAQGVREGGEAQPRVRARRQPRGVNDVALRTTSFRAILSSVAARPA